MKILLAVSGSISAYKTIDLARGLVKLGHEVKVVLTKGALEFVVPNLYTYLGVSDVYTHDDDFKHKNVLHVDLARWSDTLVVAPASANTIARLSRGEATDLLSSIFLAYEGHKSVQIYPAMNTMMLSHPFTQENIEGLTKIDRLPNVFISPTSQGLLACNEVGAGKLPSVDELLELIPILAHKKTTVKKNILATTGATIVPLDPVRYLTNSSSGITGFHLAVEALKKGHKITMIAGEKATAKLDLLVKHPDFTLIRVKTVNEMKKVVEDHLEAAQAYVSSAAISDIEFETNENKIKKETMTDSLKIKKAADILKLVIEKKQKNLKIIGFAAETDLSDAVLNKKLSGKPVDLLVGTRVDNGLINNSEVQGFNVDQAYYRFFNTSGEIFAGNLSKENMAKKLIEFIEI